MRHAAVLAFVSLLAVSCHGGHQERIDGPVTGGDADRGKEVIQAYGCGACHTIPGVRGAEGAVAPPLNFFSRRTFIAGEAPNTPENLVRWIRNPQSIEPHTAMPAVGLNDRQARDVAAYLYQLQ